MQYMYRSTLSLRTCNKSVGDVEGTRTPSFIPRNSPSPLFPYFVLPFCSISLSATRLITHFFQQRKFRGILESALQQSEISSWCCCKLSDIFVYCEFTTVSFLNNNTRNGSILDQHSSQLSRGFAKVCDIFKPYPSLLARLLQLSILLNTFLKFN